MSVIDLIIKGLFVLLIILGITMLMDSIGLLPLTLKCNYLETPTIPPCWYRLPFTIIRISLLSQYPHTFVSPHVYKTIMHHPRLLQFWCSKAC